MNTPPPTPSLVLAAYGADLISGRRVVVFGDALSGLAETLVERGARLVHVYDEQPARVAEATARATTASVSFAPMGSGGIAARDGAFDVGIIENLLASTDRAKAMTRLRRALSARGVGFVCAPNPEASTPSFSVNGALDAGKQEQPLGYYELYDLVSAEFDEIRMVGQTPFVGYALADFSPDADSEFSIDTAFVPGGAEEAERYVAVCSHFPVSLDPFCVVQIPARTLLRADATPATATPATATPQLVAVQDALAEALATAKNERELRRKHEALLQRAREELQRRDEWVAELEARAATADERADNAQSELDSAQQQVAAAARELHNARQQTAAAVHELDNAKKQEVAVRELEDAQRQAAAAAREVTAVKQQLQAAHAELDVLTAQRGEQSSGERLREELQVLDERLTQRTDEVAWLRQELKLLSSEQERMEEQLCERGRTILELQRALGDTEAFASSLLVSQLEPAETALSDVDEEEGPLTDGFGSRVHVHEAQTADASAGNVLDDAPPSGSWAALTEDDAGSDDEDSPPSGPRSSSDGTELQAALQREAEHLAALEAVRWTVEELEGKLRAQSSEDFEELLRQLHVAHQQLQRQSVLLAQYTAECSQQGPGTARPTASEARPAEE